LTEAVAAGAPLDGVARFPLALSEGGLQYMRGNFAGALEGFEAILREELPQAHGLNELLTRLWRSVALLALDRDQDGDRRDHRRGAQAWVFLVLARR
jgi:hypothetical protein